MLMCIIKFPLSFPLLFRVIWKCGQHFSTERIALAISCVEFLKGQVKVSDVFALVPPLPCFMWGDEGARNREGKYRTDLYVCWTKVSIANTRLQPPVLKPTLNLLAYKLVLLIPTNSRWPCYVYLIYVLDVGIPHSVNFMQSTQTSSQISKSSWISVTFFCYSTTEEQSAAS